MIHGDNYPFKKNTTIDDVYKKHPVMEISEPIAPTRKRCANFFVSNEHVLIVSKVYRLVKSTNSQISVSKGCFLFFKHG